LKAKLLCNGKKCPSVPTAHAVHMTTCMISWNISNIMSTLGMYMEVWKWSHLCLVYSWAVWNSLFPLWMGELSMRKSLLRGTMTASITKKVTN
jgi:hypothetical protein